MALFIWMRNTTSERETLRQRNTPLNDILVEQNSLPLDDGSRVALILDRLVHLVQHVQNGLDQIIVHNTLLSGHRVRQVLQQLVHR
mgnify:CR=1 FL=1